MSSSASTELSPPATTSSVMDCGAIFHRNGGRDTSQVFQFINCAFAVVWFVFAICDLFMCNVPVTNDPVEQDLWNMFVGCMGHSCQVSANNTLLWVLMVMCCPPFPICQMGMATAIFLIQPHIACIMCEECLVQHQLPRMRLSSNLARSIFKCLLQ